MNYERYNTCIVLCSRILSGKPLPRATNTCISRVKWGMEDSKAPGQDSLSKAQI